MSHLGKILSSIEAAERVSGPNRQRAKQFDADAPLLAHGYLPTGEVDNVYAIQRHDLTWEELKWKDKGKLSRKLVDAKIFNATRIADGVEQGDEVRAISGMFTRDMRAIGCTARVIAEMVPLADEQFGYKAFVAFPVLRPVNSENGPVIVQENASLAKASAYLLSRKAGVRGKEDKPLARLKEVVDCFGMNAVMDGLSAENTRLFQEKLKVDTKEMFKVQAAADVETGSRMLTYMMAHKRVTPEEVEREHGHGMLMQVCSKENVEWLRGLRALPPGTLQDELPMAAAYLREREGRVVEPKAHNGEAGLGHFNGDAHSFNGNGNGPHGAKAPHERVGQAKPTFQIT